MQSLDALQRIFTSRSIEAVLDGVMAVAALAMMLAYAAELAAVTVAAVLVYAAFRYAGDRQIRQLAAEQVSIAARENSFLIETIRAILPIKLFVHQEQRRMQWENLYLEAQNRELRASGLQLWFSAAYSLVFGLENLIVIYLGVRLVIDPSVASQALSVGMLFAYISYKSQFTSRFALLIDYVMELGMLRMHSERLAEIVLADPEPCEQVTHDLTNLSPTIELRNVSFRYAASEPWLLRNVNITVAPGENLSIVGASGSGKSTLLKIVLAILDPTEGEVLYGGVPVKRLGIENVRRCIGTVMQGDVLLSGTLADNISFFAGQQDEGLVRASAEVASIHQDIIRMPMGYDSLVGDLGSGLSGGQQQRLLLARALYKRPKVLVLDEATSHLDCESEKRVSDALAQLKVTRIFVAHRPETFRRADRILHLHNGQLVQPGGSSLLLASSTSL